MNGTLVDVHEEGGNNNQQIVYNLSSPFPRALDPTVKDSSQNAYFKNKGISLNDKEQIILLAQFDARKGASSSFDLSLQYTIGGQQRSLAIDDHGHPFRVTAPSCSRSEPGALDYRRVYQIAGASDGNALSMVSDPHHLLVAKASCP
jgi:hypothetical protein